MGKTVNFNNVENKSKKLIFGHLNLDI